MKTINTDVTAQSLETASWFGGSLMFVLSVDTLTAIDSIVWNFKDSPKNTYGFFATWCKDQWTCKIAPTKSGRAYAKVYAPGGYILATSDWSDVVYRCPTDPLLADDTLLQSPVVRAALKALMDSSWADSAAGERREKQVFLYRDTSDTATLPLVQPYWEGRDSLPPTPCNSWRAPQHPGSSWVLVGFAHSHPFMPSETKPAQCGPLHAGGPYERGPSTYDWTSQAAEGVPAFAVDKEVVNVFRRTPSGKREESYYPWDTAACRW